MEDLAVWMILGIVGVCVLAIAMRSLVWWWFGIGEHMQEMKAQTELLKQIAGVDMDGAKAQQQQPQPVKQAQQQTKRNPSPYDLTP